MVAKARSAEPNSEESSQFRFAAGDRRKEESLLHLAAPVDTELPELHSDTRVRAFDWLRGVAVVVMVQCHALAMLDPNLRATLLFRKVNFIDGLVAPAFLLAAGFSLGLTQVRSAARGQRLDRFRKTVLRIAEVLAVATLINCIWFFPIWNTPARLLRMDILQCVGLSLLIALPAVATLARRPLTLAAASFTACVPLFAAAPLFENVNVGGLGGQFLNRASDSPFPIFPWAGYVLLGCSIGAVCASQSRRVLIGYLAALSALGYALWMLRAGQVNLYPPHHFWETGPSQCAVRVFWVGVLAAFLLCVETRLSLLTSSSGWVRFVELFGTSSLSAYFFHQAILYMLGPLSFASPRGLWHQSLSWTEYSLATLLLLGLTYAAVRAWDATSSRAAAAWAERRAPKI